MDLCEASGQPMIDSALGLSMVFNGAIYNHQALRTESRTDALTGVGNRRALDEELRQLLRFSALPMLGQVAPRRPGWRRHVVAVGSLLTFAVLC